MWYPFKHTITKRAEAIAGELVQSHSIMGNTQNFTPKFDANKAVQQYKSWVYTAMNKNAAAIAAQPLRLFATRATGEFLPKIAPYTKISDQRLLELKANPSTSRQVGGAEEVVEITEHPFLDLMKNVNEYRNQFDFMEETSLWSDGTGNCYWLVVDGKGLTTGIPEQLWILPSPSVKIVPDARKFIKGYLFGKTGREKALTPDQVIHHRRPSLQNQWYGMGRIEGGWLAIQGYQSMEEYELHTAKNPVPSLLLNYKVGTLNRRKRSELIREFDRSINAQAGRQSNVLGVADGELDVKDIGFSPKEMSMLKGRNWRKEEIINLFGQSVALYEKDANRANIDGAIYIWGKYELDPSMSRLADKINEKLIPRYDGGDRLFCAFDKVAIADQKLMLEREKVDRENNIRTVNEIRQQDRGLPPSDEEEADQLFRPAPVMAPTPSAPGALPEKIFDGAMIHPDLKGMRIEAEV